LTGVGISIVEGGHRRTLTAKLLTGMAIDDVIPFETGEITGDVIIPVDTPIWGKTTVQVLTTRKEVEQKTHFIESTWKDWIGETVKKIQQHTNFNEKLNKLAFSKLKEPHPAKNDDKYILNYHLGMQVVAACLFDLLPQLKDLLSLQ
jgi:hypothetical protein